MAKITKKAYKDEDSKFYGASHAKKGDIIKILDEAVLKEYEYEGETYERYTCNVTVTRAGQTLGKDKSFKMNGYCTKPFIDAYGDDTNAWIGKQARVIILPTPKGDSSMIVLDVIEDIDKPFAGTKEESPF